ncbi:SMP-30/gluconolactonase/LRE family protein [Jannaschia sp. Os4]|uniref:SMP-30/gluconolactonase/LRE family protein n=1 Tax=Jannaschia sp. Os4 TaxID=2807617 RepID=UPI001939852A|nr:SMP-30/gluconolactonase/LRE family protein [Jannaschia sp. Os4]MBM2575565.1 SMP-30/gluconolactonase/LRE family protein [Jannaschia sp. Os4]
MAFFESHDPRFDRFVLGNAPVKRLATGFDWVEGPVWFGDAGCLLFSDIPNDTIHRWSPETGVSTYRRPSHNANGHTRDRQGRLISCEHRTRRVTRTEWDGTITVLADSYEGRPLNSPNDVIVASDGTVFFSDPHYGIMMDYEGERAEEENARVVYRLDPATGALEQVVTDMACPNGLCLSPDESLMYVADTGRMWSDDPQHIRVYDMLDGRPANGRDFAKPDVGIADGIRCDEDGLLWSSAGDGVHCFDTDGTLLGKILVPETVSNLCFGGRRKHVLYMTGTTSIYSVALARRGVQWP